MTVVEMDDRLAPGEEPEVSAELARIFADDGIVLPTGALVTAARADEAGRAELELREAGGAVQKVVADLIYAPPRSPLRRWRWTI